MNTKLYVVGAVPRRKFEGVQLGCGCIVMWPKRSIKSGAKPCCPAHERRLRRSA